MSNYKNYKVRRQEIINEIKNFDPDSEPYERYSELCKALYDLDAQEPGRFRFRRYMRQWARQNGFSWCYWVSAIGGACMILWGLQGLFDSYLKRYPEVWIFMMITGTVLAAFSIWLLTYED